MKFNHIHPHSSEIKTKWKKSRKICFWNTFAEILSHYKIYLQINLVVLRTTSKHLRFCWYKVSDKKEYKINLYSSFSLHICNMFRWRYEHVPPLQWTSQYNLNFFIISFFSTQYFFSFGSRSFIHGSHKMLDQLQSNTHMYLQWDIFPIILSDHISEICVRWKNCWSQQPHLINLCILKSNKVINTIMTL